MLLLEGIKVVDFTRYFPGPFATLRLEEWGAEVIKVEDPNGDPSRVMGTLYRAMNRGKQSVCADLKDAAQREIVLDLMKSADIVVEGFRPGVADRLGIGYEAARAMNPEVVYCSISGYGQKTSLARLSGHDLNYMALAGMLAQFSDASGRPIKPKIALADAVSGIVASEAILAGLVRKSRTGEGAYLDISITEAVSLLLGLHVAELSESGVEMGDQGVISYNIYESKDGRFVTLGAMEEKFWVNFCTAVARPDLIPAKDTPDVAENSYFGEMVDLMKSRTFSEWTDFFLTVDCCFAPVFNVGELAGLPWVKERGLIEHKWGLDHMATHYPNGDGFLDYAIAYAELGENALQL